MYKIYMLLFPSNKVYIGLTGCDVNKRWNNGYGYHSPFISNAIKKYGWNNVQKFVLYDNLTVEQAKDKEIELIKWFDSTNRLHGYNISTGGESRSGAKCSDEVKQYLRMLKLGNKLSEEAKRKISERELGANNPMAKRLFVLKQ